VFTVRRLLTLLAALLTVPLLTAGAQSAAAAPVAAPAAVPAPAAAAAPVAPLAAGKPTFVVDGRVAHPKTLSVADLRRFPAHREVVRYIAAGKQETHHFRGALLTDVLAAAKPRFDPAVKHDELRHAVLVGATDGYATVLSWGEIDPGFANTGVLLATEQDGQALARPRLVVPSDKEGGRYVTDVSSVSLLRVGG
jgi:DMSO/TMAO reductase YedYZ molybdopterin-dependent catalytic subunit